MEKYNMNGMTAELNHYETPFADVPVMREQTDQSISAEGFFSNYSQEVDSPFSRTYEAASGSNTLTQEGEEYVGFISELNDSEFTESLYELANEMEDSWRNKISNELALGNNYLPYVNRQANEYIAPLLKEAESMIDKVGQYFSVENLADHSDAEIESYFETLEFDHSQFTPVQDQFLGRLFKKVKSVVKKGVDLAKKGIKFAGKYLPLNVILRKIKALVKPLLNKVLKFAIGKLPKNLQPYARTLANKFLNLEADFENTNDTTQSENGLEGIQSELDNHLTQLLFTPNEQEADTLVMEYENSFDALERTDDFESEISGSSSLDAARQQFINELKNLQADESPAPAIERFLPIQPAIKLAISIIGRPKVINFLAGLLAKLVSKYVPENVAKPLAASIVDVGMRTMGFEVNDEAGQSDLAYEAIANTIEETFQNMNSLNEAAINDSEELTMQLLEAFEQAAADNFPSQYIKEELRPTKQRALWIKMPRKTPVKYYKKYTHPYEITIDPNTASSVKIFRGLPLANFLRDKYGLDSSKPIKAKVFLFEAIRGTRLTMISRYENLPGLNARQPKAWIQLLPLTKQASSLLLKEYNLGRDINLKNLTTRFRTKPGQRFYYLEIEGVKLRIPQVNRTALRHTQNGKPPSITESRSADIQCVLNFIKSEIKLNYYFSEEDAIAVLEKLNKNDVLGAAINIRQSVKNVLNDLLIKNIPGKVKIVHEAIPELYLENRNDNEEQFAPLDALGKIAGKGLITNLIGKLVEKISSLAYDTVVNFFKARAAEFKTAQAQPQDGVTIKIIWKNVSGMSTIRAIINAIKGKLSVGNLSELSLPNFPVPEIKIDADKKFD